MSKTSPKTSDELSAKAAKPKNVGKDRKKLALAAAEPKSARIAKLLTRPDGATIAEMMKMTGWQAHSVHPGSAKRSRPEIDRRWLLGRAAAETGGGSRDRSG